jgi:hypothetical protein
MQKEIVRFLYSMSNKQIHLLFLASFIGIFIIYLLFLNTITIVGLLIDELLFVVILFILVCISLYYKQGLKGYDLIDFNQDSSMSLKNIILFFLFFQVIDFIYEDGFVGMIKMWFSYWVFGYIAFYIMNIISYYKNYKRISS